jgi:hypothetical protein
LPKLGGEAVTMAGKWRSRQSKADYIGRATEDFGLNQ